MEFLKCAFRHTLIRGEFGCRHAHAVTRREGPDVGCESAPAQARCASLLATLRGAALPAFAVTDDLTQMPHSVLVKIQFGGLLGLQRLLDTTAEADRVADIDALVDQAAQRYRGVERVPCEDLIADMTGYRLRRRR